MEVADGDYRQKLRVSNPQPFLYNSLIFETLTGVMSAASKVPEVEIHPVSPSM